MFPVIFFNKKKCYSGHTTMSLSKDYKISAAYIIELSSLANIRAVINEHGLGGCHIIQGRLYRSMNISILLNRFFSCCLSLSQQYFFLFFFRNVPNAYRLIPASLVSPDRGQLSDFLPSIGKKRKQKEGRACGRR